MPTVLRIDGMRVVIYPNDHRPAHVHVAGAGGEAACVATPGLLLADKGLISKELSAVLAERETSLTTPMRKNMRDDRPQSIVQHAMRLRRRIETAFGRLVDGFNITRTHGRDFRRWSARVCRKVLAYNVLLRLDRAMSVA